MGELEDIRGYSKRFFPLVLSSFREFKECNTPLPLPLNDMCFWSFWSIYTWLEKLGFLVNQSPYSWNQVQENVVRLKILYLLLWLATYKVKVFASPCTKSNRLWKEKCWTKFRYSYIQYFFLWHYNYTWEDQHFFLRWLWAVKDS